MDSTTPARPGPDDLRRLAASLRRAIGDPSTTTGAPAGAATGRPAPGAAPRPAAGGDGTVGAPDQRDTPVGWALDAVWPAGPNPPRPASRQQRAALARAVRARMAAATGGRGPAPVAAAVPRSARAPDDGRYGPTWPSAEGLLAGRHGGSPGAGRRSRGGGGGPGATGRPVGSLWSVGLPLMALVLLGTAVVLLNGHAPATPPARPATGSLAGASPAARFTPATAPPAAAPPSVAAGPPLAAREVFGFAPWWTLGQEAGFDAGTFTTVAYFSIDLGPDGSLAASGPGWDGLHSQALADLVTRMHGAAHRVVLTLSCFDQATLDALAGSPAAGTAAAAETAAQVVPLLQQLRLDGVNLDLEGTGSGDRSGLDAYVAALHGRLSAVDPSWQLTMDTYGSSAGDASGFSDVGGLAPSVDAFFVMAYDMGSATTPGPTAPLSGGPGFSDAAAVAQYLAAVPASKVILGVPFYGYDWPVAGPGLGAAATGPPTAVTEAQVAGGTLARYWDPASQTPWGQYRRGSQWFEVYWDDPASVAAKAQLAAGDHLAGVGAWALGMAGGDAPAMTAALLGRSPGQSLPQGPTASAADQVPRLPASPGSGQAPGAPPGAPGAPGTPAGSVPATAAAGGASAAPSGAPSPAATGAGSGSAGAPSGPGTGSAGPGLLGGLGGLGGSGSGSSGSGSGAAGAGTAPAPPPTAPASPASGSSAGASAPSGSSGTAPSGTGSSTDPLGGLLNGL